MNSYIVDASIVVQLLITEPHTSETRVLFKGIDSGDMLYLPEFALIECTNVLWKHVRFYGVALNDAKKQITILTSLDVVLIPVAGFLPRALEIGSRHQLAIYDSVYIALAEHLGHPLITDDTKQARAATAGGLTLKPITDFTTT
jgi:predicted nucleic acid-binding protein